MDIYVYDLGRVVGVAVAGVFRQGAGCLIFRRMSIIRSMSIITGQCRLLVHHDTTTIGRKMWSKVRVLSKVEVRVLSIRFCTQASAGVWIDLPP